MFIYLLIHSKNEMGILTLLCLSQFHLNDIILLPHFTLEAICMCAVYRVPQEERVLFNDSHLLYLLVYHLVP